MTVGLCRCGVRRLAALREWQRRALARPQPVFVFVFVFVRYAVPEGAGQPGNQLHSVHLFCVSVLMCARVYVRKHAPVRELTRSPSSRLQRGIKLGKGFRLRCSP